MGISFSRMRKLLLLNIQIPATAELIRSLAAFLQSCINPNIALTTNKTLEQNMKTFWNEEHPLSAISNYLTSSLMPLSGKCNTLQGELFRASSEISYDWFNNGWGRNNWSGAVVFLQKHFKDLPDPKSFDKLYSLLSEVYYFSHGQSTVWLEDDRAEVLVTTIHEIVVQAILENPVPIPNEKDMWDYSEDEPT